MRVRLVTVRDGTDAMLQLRLVAGIVGTCILYVEYPNPHLRYVPRQCVYYDDSIDSLPSCGVYEEEGPAFRQKLQSTIYSKEGRINTGEGQRGP